MIMIPSNISRFRLLIMAHFLFKIPSLYPECVFQLDQHEHAFSSYVRNTGCCPEDLPRAMNDRWEWRERVRDIHGTSTT